MIGIGSPHLATERSLGTIPWKASTSATSAVALIEIRTPSRLAPSSSNWFFTINPLPLCQKAWIHYCMHEVVASPFFWPKFVVVEVKFANFCNFCGVRCLHESLFVPGVEWCQLWKLMVCCCIQSELLVHLCIFVVNATFFLKKYWAFFLIFFFSHVWKKSKICHQRSIKSCEKMCKSFLEHCVVVKKQNSCFRELWEKVENV